MIETKSHFVYSIPAADVYQALASRPQGLTRLEAAERLKRIGINALEKIKGRPLYLKFLANFTHLMASPLEEGLRQQIMTANDDYARGGLRVLAVAQREMVSDVGASPGNFMPFRFLQT